MTTLGVLMSETWSVERGSTTRSQDLKKHSQHLQWSYNRRQQKAKFSYYLNDHARLNIVSRMWRPRIYVHWLFDQCFKRCRPANAAIEKAVGIPMGRLAIPDTIKFTAFLTTLEDSPMRFPIWDKDIGLTSVVRDVIPVWGVDYHWETSRKKRRLKVHKRYARLI